MSKLGKVSMWSASSNAPRGVITRWVTLWTVAYMSGLVGWVTWRLFSDSPPEIGAGAATAYATLLGTGLAGAWALYKWAREPEDRDERKEIRDDRPN